ncbi:rna-directed dna polymerase from mobile element jockey-like [Limosa lapponica baueri]|uniref:Rna-directed dna polymerase from mobile element jockey-like n=1 Tax=Limosa lapponica baueri TaxID=1758121 RepID=A0A2I0UI32_LIMLA|nr:rna-directed dna polymerase from mobile element jockey-like [Limosa lapponica baueri]
MESSEIECTLSKSADDTKLCGAVNMLEGRDVIQRDLHRLEKWTCANFLKFSKAKCKVLYLVLGNPKHKDAKMASTGYGALRVVGSTPESKEHGEFESVCVFGGSDKHCSETLDP